MDFKMFNWKKEQEEDEDLLQFEIDLRLAELADLEFLKNPDEVIKLGEHIAKLQHVHNEKQAEKDKARKLSPDLVGKAVLTVVSMTGLFLLQRGGIIDRGMEKFIPKP